MELEQIIKIDLYLKAKGGVKSLMDIDHLMVASDDKDAVNKIKASAASLMKVEQYVDSELLELWKDLFKKQVRSSVDRVKNSKKKE